MGVTSNKNNKLIIRFRVSGHPKQFYLSTGLKDNKSNRAIVDSRWELIQREISLDEFDSTLDRYKFGNKKKIKEELSTKYTLSELWDKFTDFKSQTIEQTSFRNYEIIGRLIKEFPENPVDIRNYLIKNHSYSRAKTIIEFLSRCLDWAVESGLTNENKFKNLKLPNRKKSSREEIAAYTLQERDLIIYTFENHPKFSHYTNLIKFLFWTGCRPGEAFALTWGDINLDCSKITISKSFASHQRLLKGTKNGKKRVFPAAPGGKLQAMLMGIRKNQNPNDLVFVSKQNKQLNLRALDKIWRGHRIGGYVYPGVVKELADKGKLPYLKAYSTRHTFATWAIATGSSPDKVAYWLGDNVETVLTYYCHPEISKSDCPDF